MLGAFLLVTSGRLMASGAAAWAAGFAAMVLAIAAMAAAGCRWPSPAVNRARLLLSPVLVNVVYVLLGSVVLHLHVPLRDGTLLRVDRMLLGTTPAMLTAKWNSPFLTEVLSGCYLLFFPAVLAAFAAGILRPLSGGVRLFDGLISIYALGFLGYSLVPASGPHLAVPEAFPAPLAGGVLTQFNSSLVEAGSNRVDAFPSLHAAVTVFLMAWLWPRHRRLFFALLAPAAGLCAATIYLRYHYAVDVFAGVVLAGTGLRLARNPVLPYESHSSI